MDVKLIVTKACAHCKNMMQELNDLNVQYDVIYVEDNPELVKLHNIRHSPNVLVNNEVVSRGQTTEGELKALLNIE